MYFERPPEIELIRQMARQNPAAGPAVYTGPQPDNSAFIIKPAANWLETAGKQAEAQMLFDHFWYQHELCILFADTNVGKSILAVQIADSISRGAPIGNFEMKAQPASVLYFDFELSDKQFEKRYTAGAYGNYKFNGNFLRAEANPQANGDRKFSRYEDYIYNALENALITTKAQVLIIDNITCLRYGTQAAAGALNLVRNLQTLKTRYKLSIMVLAHTPKRNPAKPLTRNDLQGSKMLINFCDSAFAIGESQTVAGLRYLKQIKQRSSSETYGAAGVCLCQISKPYNFLQFDFTGYGCEADHLMHYTEQHRKNTETRVAQLSHQGLTMRQVANQLNIAGSTVCRILKRLENS